MKASRHVGFCVCLLLLCSVTWANPPQQLSFHIEAQPLEQALNVFANQAGLDLLYPVDGVMTSGFVAPKVVGTLTPQAALDQLLANTGLKYEFVNAKTVTIKTIGKPGVPLKKVSSLAADKPIVVASGEVGQNMEFPQPSPTPQADGSTDSTSTTNNTASANSDAIPQILIKGSRSLNTDIQRTRDDIQPYVVFSADEIQSSQAENIEEFLRTRLPMDTQQGSNSQATEGSANNRSQFNLRGLGTNQTLILLDGRRMPGTYGSDASGNTTFNQPDVNGIPIAAIERIEILPTTASGIYGGGATGGVINIILKRNYSGLNLNATYGNTFDMAAKTRKVTATAGFDLEGGLTNVLMTASYSDADKLLAEDRDFTRRARALQVANNPGVFLDSAYSVPLGYTTNIGTIPVFNPSTFTFSQPNLTLKNGTPLNSPITSVPVGYAGPATDGGEALVTNAGHYNLNVPHDVTGDLQTLLPAPTVESVSVSPRRRFGDNVEGFVDFSWLRNRSQTSGVGDLGGVITLPSTATNNPFNEDILVQFPKPNLSIVDTTEDTTLRGTGGLIVHFPQDWNAEADYVWSRVRTLQTGATSVLTPAGNAALSDGTLNVLRDLNAFPLNYSPYLLPQPTSVTGPTDITLNNIPAHISGPILKLPGGPLIVTGLAEYRKEEAANSYQNFDAIGMSFTSFVPSRSQTVRSYAIQSTVPIISAINSLPGIRVLEIQTAVRYDDYATRSTENAIFVPSRDSPLPELSYTTNRTRATKYTVGLRYVPLEDLTVRASFGTGFLPPSIGQIVEFAPYESPLFVMDPRRGGTVPPGNVTFIGGGNPNLRPEESESFSAGMIVTPRFFPNWRLSVDYTRIQKSDDIAQLQDQQIVDLESNLPGHVIRGQNLPGDLPGWPGPIVAINDGLVNISATRLDAFDAQSDYQLSTTKFGKFHFYAIASYERRFQNQIVPTSPFTDSVGFSDGPLKWRGNTGLTWDWNSWTAGWNARYYDSYRVYNSTDPESLRAVATLSQGSSAVPNQIYHDVYALYRFAGDTKFAHLWLQNASVNLGIQNVFNTSPPVLATFAPFGGYSTYGDPRLRRFSITLQKQF